VSVFRTLGGGLGLWFPVYHPESTIVRRAPALTLYKRVFFSLFLHTCIFDALPRSLCGWHCTSLHLLEEKHNHPIVRFAYLCHMIGEELVFISFFYIKLFELGVEVAFNNRSTVTHHKVDLFTFPLWSSSFERTDDAFVLLICFSVFTSRNPSSLSVDNLNSKIFTICISSLIATLSSCLPQKRFTKKYPGSRLYRAS